MSSNEAEAFREALEEGNYDPDEGITDDSDTDTTDTDSTSDFGEELGTGQRTSGGESTDTTQTESDATESDSGSGESTLTDSPLDTGAPDTSTGSVEDNFDGATESATETESGQDFGEELGGQPAESGEQPSDAPDPQVDTGAGEAVSSIGQGDATGADGEGVPDTGQESTDTVQGGSFRQAPESVGGGYAPPSEAAAAEGSPVDAGVETLLGPPGQVESFAGSVASGVGGASADAARTINRQVVDPVAGIIGSQTEGAANIRVETTDEGAKITGEEGVGGPLDTEPDTGLGRTVQTGVSGLGRGAVGATVGAPAEAVNLGNLVADAGEFTATQIEEEGVEQGLAESGEAAVETGQQAASQFVSAAQQNPVLVGATLVGGGVATFGGGRALGKAIRGTKKRARTAGGTDVDASDLADEDVLEGNEQFPGARDEARYRTDPAGQVREQAERKTPDQIDAAFEEAGVTSGTTLKKSIPDEPAGPERGRTAQGFKSAVVPEDETGIDPDDITEEQVVSRQDSPGEFSYENPGSFVSPETSPYFLGGATERAGYSLRPGLPDTDVDRSTITLVRTEVEEPDADTQLEFAREMAEREGETTAFTKPRGSKDLNPGEIEAVVPAGAEFADVGTGPVRNALRRVGIGADYRTRIGGRDVPVRLVAPESDLDSGSRTLTGILDDEAGTLGKGTRRSRVRRDLERPNRTGQPVDRPLPTGFVPSTGNQTRGTETPESGGGPTRPTSEPRDTAEPQPTGGPAVGGDDTSEPGGPGGGPPEEPQGGGQSEEPPGGAGPPDQDRPTGGSDTPGGAGGSGGPDEPTDGGQPTPGPNRPLRIDTPDTSQDRRRRDFGDEGEPDDDEFITPFAGIADPYGTDFRNPLTGNVLETELPGTDTTDK